MRPQSELGFTSGASEDIHEKSLSDTSHESVEALNIKLEVLRNLLNEERENPSQEFDGTT